MAEQVGRKSWQPSFKFYCAFYAVMMLLSIDQIYESERAVHGRGWNLHFVICVPWVMALMGGALLLIFRNRRKLEDHIAGSILFFLTFVVSSAYSAISKLAGMIH